MDDLSGADNIVDLAEMRKKLRPKPKPFVESLMDTLRMIDAVRAAQSTPNNG